MALVYEDTIQFSKDKGTLQQYLIQKACFSTIVEFVANVHLELFN